MFLRQLFFLTKFDNKAKLFTVNGYVKQKSTFKTKAFVNKINLFNAKN